MSSETIDLEGAIPAGVPNDSLYLSTATDQTSLSIANPPSSLSSLSTFDSDDKYILPTAHRTPSVAIDLKHLSQAGTRSLSTVQDLVHTLGALDVDGPLPITDKLYDFIGKGSQFSVYRNHIYRGASASKAPQYIHQVAVKRSFFIVDNDSRLDLSTKGASQQLHDMHLEILALRHPRLRTHRNIVKLIGWARDWDWHGAPLLVQELAIADLERFLLSGDDRLNWEVRHHLCLDIGAGLDVLHENRIIHGDLKPANVLVFSHPTHEVPFIAKLADFGFSTFEAENLGLDSIKVPACTPGWNAPEISQYETELPVSQYCKADNYSFGLTIWSILCLNGRAPSSSSKKTVSLYAIDAVQSMPEIPALLQETSCAALKDLLELRASDRPYLVADIMVDGSPACQNWTKDCSMYLALDRKELSAYLAENFIEDRWSISNHKWSLPGISHYAVQGIRITFNNDEKCLSANELFAIFLYISFNDILEIGPDIDTIYIKALLQSARMGFVPAQAVISRVFASYSLLWPKEVTSEVVRQWLFNGASTGSILAMADLKAIEPELAKSAAHAFHNGGGYNQHYVGIIPSRELEKANLAEQLAMNPDDTEKLDLCASLAVLGNSEALHKLLSTITVPLNAISFVKGTALYLACRTGSVKTVRVLCSNGADASIAEESRGVTCFHWLFNFPSESIEEVADLLLHHGGNPNAVARKSHLQHDHHFPFKWPFGAPLHWAVAARNPTAVTALLSHGADAGLRNRADPYLDDMNVRYMEAEGDYDQGGYSHPACPVAGLNMLDIAAANHDWQILRRINSLQNNTVDIMQSDEEGYTPFHRLEYAWVGRTFWATRFWSPAFEGPPETRQTNIRHTVEALLAMGGQIDALTKSADYSTLADHPNGNMTPLILAVRRGDLDAVIALLQCGANPNIRNDQGMTALALLPEGGDPTVRPGTLPLIAQILLRYGARPVHDFSSSTTPLAAAVNSSPDVFHMLLAAGAQPTESRHGLNVVAMLLSSYRIKERTLNGSTDSTLVEHQIKSIIKKYVLPCFPAAHPGMLEQVDEQGGTLLHYAAYAGFPDIVELLLQFGVKSNIYREFVHPSRWFSENRRETEIKHKTPLDEMLYKNYLWQYNGYAKVMEYGTPLDCVLCECFAIRKMMVNKEYNISIADLRHLMETYDRISELLLSYGGTYMRPLTAGDPAF